MPPSGYSVKQSRCITDFLASCAAALLAECRAAGRTPLEGLKKECADIGRALATGWSDPVSRPVLELTAEFYGQVLQQAPTTEEKYAEAVQQVLRGIGRAIEDVHL